MLRSVQGYDIFAKIANGQIIAYDINYNTKEIDWSSVGIMRSVDEEFAQAICEALDIKSVEDYGVTIHKDSDYEC